MARTRSRYLSTTIGVAARLSTTVISPAANRSSASRSSPFLPATTIARTPGNDASGIDAKRLGRAAAACGGIGRGGGRGCRRRCLARLLQVPAPRSAAGSALPSTPAVGPAASARAPAAGWADVAAGGVGAGSATGSGVPPRVSAQAPIAAITHHGRSDRDHRQPSARRRRGTRLPVAGNGPATMAGLAPARGVGSIVTAVAASSDA
jgi:hypothetical protein